MASAIDPRQLDLPQVNLHPGELFVARHPTVINTILGSCVSVCLFCPPSRLGAMCHGVMPVLQEHDTDIFHFVDTSVSYMVEVMAGLQGFSCSRLEAKLFGGADVLRGYPECASSTASIGVQNILAARAALKKHGVTIVNERVGGELGCKLYFYSHTGEVYLRPIQRFNESSWLEN